MTNDSVGSQASSDAQILEAHLSGRQAAKSLQRRPTAKVLKAQGYTREQIIAFISSYTRERANLRKSDKRFLGKVKKKITEALQQSKFIPVTLVKENDAISSNNAPSLEGPIYQFDLAALERARSKSVTSIFPETLLQKPAILRKVKSYDYPKEVQGHSVTSQLTAMLQRPGIAPNIKPYVDFHMPPSTPEVLADTRFLDPPDSQYFTFFTDFSEYEKHQLFDEKALLFTERYSNTALLDVENVNEICFRSPRKS